MRLKKDVFLALSTIVWADGVVTEDEAEALLSAARASGIAGKDLDAVERAVREKKELAELGALSLSDDERLFVYGIATWLARVDGTVTLDELDAIARLGDALGLEPASRVRVAATQFAIQAFDAGHVGGARPSHDVRTLARAIEAASHDTP